MAALIGLAMLVSGQLADGDEITLLAAQTGIDEQDLRGAMFSQPEVSTRNYLRFIGALPEPVAPMTAYGGVWDRLANCESNGRWNIATGNGYYGGLQFDLPSWRAAGGRGMPHQAPKAEQIRVAENWLHIAGWKAWPVCSRRLGLR